MYFLKAFKFLFFSITCVLFLAACGGSSNTPESVAQDYFKAMIAGETDKVISLMNVSADQAKAIRLQMDMYLKEKKKEFDAKGGVKSVTVVSTKLSDDGNSAQVILETELKNDESQTQNLEVYSLKKVDGQWKVG